MRGFERCTALVEIPEFYLGLKPQPVPMGAPAPSMQGVASSPVDASPNEPEPLLNPEDRV